MTIPLAKKKETTTSQMTSFVKAERAAAKGRVLVARRRVRTTRDQAPMGRGDRMRPTTAERNRARRDHDLGVREWGRGTANRKMTPTARVTRRGRGLAPCHRRKVVVDGVSVGGGGDGGGAPGEIVDILGDLILRFGREKRAVTRFVVL